MARAVYIKAFRRSCDWHVLPRLDPDEAVCLNHGQSADAHALAEGGRRHAHAGHVHATVSNVSIGRRQGELTSKPSGGRVTAGTVGSGMSCPGQTQTKPSASVTGRALTRTPLQKAVEGMRVQEPLPSYSQPWYGHCMQPSTTDPCARILAPSARSGIVNC